MIDKTNLIDIKSTRDHLSDSFRRIRDLFQRNTQISETLKPYEKQVTKDEKVIKFGFYIYQIRQQKLDAEKRKTDLSELNTESEKINLRKNFTDDEVDEYFSLYMGNLIFEQDEEEGLLANNSQEDEEQDSDFSEDYFRWSQIYLFKRGSKYFPTAEYHHPTNPQSLKKFKEFIQKIHQGECSDENTSDYPKEIVKLKKLRNEFIKRYETACKSCKPNVDTKRDLIFKFKNQSIYKFFRLLECQANLNLNIIRKADGSFMEGDDDDDLCCILSSEIKNTQKAIKLVSRYQGQVDSLLARMGATKVLKKFQKEIYDKFKWTQACELNDSKFFKHVKILADILPLSRTNYQAYVRYEVDKEDNPYDENYNNNTSPNEDVPPMTDFNDNEIVTSNSFFSSATLRKTSTGLPKTKMDRPKSIRTERQHLADRRKSRHNRKNCDREIDIKNKFIYEEREIYIFQVPDPNLPDDKPGEGKNLNSNDELRWILLGGSNDTAIYYSY